MEMEDQKATTDAMASDAAKPVFVITHGARRPKSWQNFSRRLREERGPRCESCERVGHRVVCHHVLEYALFPPCQREPGNILVLCDRCHSKATAAERFPQERALYYSRLPLAIRQRTREFLAQHAPQQQMLLSALATGYDYWPARYP